MLLEIEPPVAGGNVVVVYLREEADDDGVVCRNTVHGIAAFVSFLVLAAVDLSSLVQPHSVVGSLVLALQPDADASAISYSLIEGVVAILVG